MGTKTSTQEVTLPDPTWEEHQAYSKFNALLDAQMSRDYEKRETWVPRRNEFGATMPDPNRPGELLYETQFTYDERPEVKARRLKNEAEQQKIQDQFYKVTEKVLSGDFSITPQQKEQIKQYQNEYFDPTMDLLRAEFDRSETAVTSAVTRLMESGKSDMLFQLGEQSKALRKGAETLGRSYSDSAFQRETAQNTTGAFERLTRAGTADMAQAVASLRGQRTMALGGVQENKGLAGLNLAMQAANPLAAFGAGNQFGQLQNSINAQNAANAYLPIDAYAQNFKTQGQLRSAQPTTTTKTPWGILDVLGALSGAAGAGAKIFTGLGG